LNSCDFYWFYSWLFVRTDCMIVTCGNLYNLSRNNCILWCIGSVALSYDCLQDHTIVWWTIIWSYNCWHDWIYDWSYDYYELHSIIRSMIMICDRLYDLSLDYYLWSFVRSNRSNASDYLIWLLNIVLISNPFSKQHQIQLVYYITFDLFVFLM